jgi:L-ascorbate metabolism protein UlaG (beta-lactamase superfamily)
MNASEQDLTIRYIGGPTVMLSIDGVRFITDPTFDAAGASTHLGTRPVIRARPGG